LRSTQTLRVGIDLTGVWRPSTGIFVYAINLARELLRIDDQNSYTLFFSGNIHPEFKGLGARFRPVVIPVREEVIAKQALLAALSNAHKLDLVHFPSFPPAVACLRRFIWTLHDATPWLHPDTMDLKGRLYFGSLGRWAARLSTAIITVSNHAKRDIIGCMPHLESKVRVIYSGIEREFKKLHDLDFLNSVRARYHLPEHFVLTVGTLEPRKNLPFLIDAYQRFCATSTNRLGLVIAGRTGWNTEAIQKRLSDAGGEIVLAGFVPQSDLVALYNLADVFVLPSLYEGFGLPPLEAMACGCPVIVSNRGSLPEIVRDAALLLDPENIDSLVGALQSVIHTPSLRTSLVEKGLARVSEFSWTTAARKTLEVYKEVAGGA
jgi:glycosyltransferase involved in cell wall biosynthesis